MAASQCAWNWTGLYDIIVPSGVICLARKQQRIKKAAPWAAFFMFETLGNDYLT